MNTTGRMIAWGSYPFGALLGGALAEGVGVQTRYLIACAPVAVAAVAVWRPSVRALGGPRRRSCRGREMIVASGRDSVITHDRSTSRSASLALSQASCICKTSVMPSNETWPRPGSGSAAAPFAPDDVAIVRFRDWRSVRAPDALLDLVDRVQREPPYSYRSDEAPPAADWFPALALRTDLTFIAYRSTTQPVGYCVALPLLEYQHAADVVAVLDGDPTATLYLAELAVATSARRRGLAGTLVERALQASPANLDRVLVRTLASNEPAIALYERLGFRVRQDAHQQWHGRDRVFLTRPVRP